MKIFWSYTMTNLCYNQMCSKMKGSTPYKQDQTLLWTCIAGARRCVNSLYAKFKYTVKNIISNVHKYRVYMFNV